MGVREAGLEGMVPSEAGVQGRDAAHAGWRAEGIRPRKLAPGEGLKPRRWRPEGMGPRKLAPGARK